MPKTTYVVEALGALTRECERYKPGATNTDTPLLFALGATIGAKNENEADTTAAGRELAVVITQALDSYLNDKLLEVPLDLIVLGPKIDDQIGLIVEQERTTGDTLTRLRLVRQKHFLEAVHDTCKWMGICEPGNKMDDNTPFRD